jgi:tetraacyldisaccharide 4'-kinase
MSISLVNRVWHGDDLAARTARAALRPAEFLYRQVIARRNASFDARRESAGATRSRLLPAISVGNLTVGGTGKTPVAAWCVQRLREQGANPAIVMRGYGDDEWRVHTLLNPGTQVVVGADRVAGVITARTRGADCAVLDDAFQHRRVPRVVDLVLVSVDSWTDHVRLLPAGPFREGLDALQRASIVVLTRKAVSDEGTARAMAAIRRAAPSVPFAAVSIVPSELRLATSLGARGTANEKLPRPTMLSHPPTWLSGRRVIAASAIGNPVAFESQLETFGAILADRRRFRDHHVFTPADAADLARRGETADGVVCTLKDAVKLATLWPRQAPPLWYVSQTVVVDSGADALQAVLARVLAARVTTLHTAG